MEASAKPTTNDFLLGGGEMGKLIRSINWSETPVGPIEDWPQSLRTSVSIMLNTHFPMYVAWGREFTQFYNDGYRPILGSTKHPAAMGRSSTITFSEIWNIIGPMFDGVMEGNAVGFTDFMLPLDRHGFTEECYFIFSYSPIKQENGLTGGVLVTVTETTDRLLGERRLKTLREVADRSSKSKNLKEASTCVLSAIDTNKHDIPFSLFFIFDPVQNQFVLAGSTGVDMEKTALHDIDKLNLIAAESPMTALSVQLVFKTVAYQADLPWPETPQYCCATTLSWTDQDKPFGFLIFGVSPRLRYDDHYNNFFKLLTDQAVTALSNANAFEEARKRAEALAEIDRAKTAFFSNVSHEFRTPLTLMLGPLEELLRAKGSLSKEQLENADAAHRNANRLLRLVNTLLDFSRIESGRIQAEFRPVDWLNVTADLCSNFRSIVERAGLQLKVECEKITDAVYVDFAMWEKIVLNLLSNAFKYTLKGSITIGLRQHEKHVEMRVADTGVGIPEKELPSMFERFHRVANAGGRSYEGTGIGLSLVNELVKLHGGTITVKSKVNEGSTFIVTLPTGFSHLPKECVFHDTISGTSSALVDSFLQEATMLSSNEVYDIGDNIEAPQNSASKDKTILLVDDNADMIRYLTRILESSYHVLSAQNGKVALEKIEEHVPDLVISDIMMPVMDGVQMLTRIKANPQTTNLPVMLLSARAGEESRIEGFDYGADDYLVKPFSAKELVARVRSQIQIATTRSHLSTLLKQVFDQTPAAITIIRRDNYTIEFANDLYLQIVDKGREFIGRGLFESLPELKDQGIRELLDKVMAAGEPHRGEEFEIFLERQGEKQKTYFNFIYHPLRETDGSITGVIVVCYEVTDLVLARKRAEESEMILEAKVKERTAELEGKNEELTQQNDFIETILNSSLDVISVFDADLRFLIVNNRFEELYKRSRGEIVGKRIDTVFPGMLHNDFYSYLTSAAKGIPCHTNRFVSPLTNRLFELYVLPLTYNDEVYAILAVAHDNTELMEFANKLEEKNNLLLKVNQELEQFAYVASHDLQEPLRKIKTFASMVERSTHLNGDAQKYFGKIHLSADRMSRLIKDLLNYSRLSSGEVSIEEVDLNQTIASVVSDFELMIEEKGARISYSNLPVVKGIPLQIHQMCSNLISNSLKFSRTNPVIDIKHRIVSHAEYVKYQPMATQTEYLELLFRDNGIGFDQRYSDQIFTIFQRLHEKEASGTGIGLALCKKIVENHKGSIRVESAPGAGSSFFVYLPMN